MAITLTEAEKYTTNSVKKGVLKEIIKDSVIMQRLPFITVTGNAYQYLREKALGTVSFYSPNEVWTEDTGTVYQVTASLKIMGGDADVDNFLKATRSDKTDFTAETIANKAKGVKHGFLDKFWYGSSAASTKEFDGIHRIFLTGGESAAALTNQTVNAGSGSTGAALSLKTHLDAAHDKLRDGTADCIISTRGTRSRVTQFITAGSGTPYTMMDKDDWGNLVANYRGVPWHIDDFLVETETISSSTFSAKTGGATSSVFFLRFGTDDLFGIQNGSLETQKLGQLETKDGMRWRIRWYVGLGLGRTIGQAKVDGVTTAAVVA